MNKKIIAVGNMVMCDDGIGIKIAEFLHYDFKLLGYDTIIIETNIENCIDKIEDSDFLIVVGSSYYDIEPGTINLTPLNEVNLDSLYFSQYILNLLELIKTSNKNVSGFLISVEASEFYFNPDLSYDLNSKLDTICKKLLNYISVINRLNLIS
ncbi:hydrogenase maturation protease [Clostridium thailandense]|uniref:hydrogenase maturation protease n=1 Tax=Clostridium thailandense TaxID=2794346 RepID=UPI003989DC08